MVRIGIGIIMTIAIFGYTIKVTVDLYKEKKKEFFMFFVTGCFYFLTGVAGYVTYLFSLGA